MLTCFTVMEVPQVIVVVPESQPVTYGQPVALWQQLLASLWLASPCLASPWLASPCLASAYLASLWLVSPCLASPWLASPCLAQGEDDEAQKAHPLGFHCLSLEGRRLTG